MAGIYLHIPFCKQSCSYCDFHFSTSLKHKTDLIQALVKEIEGRKNQLTEQIETIYFGGGTPSLLGGDDLKLIIEALYTNYTVADKIEFTLECNPDDLSKEKLKELNSAGVNRLSIGVQSFNNEELNFFNRAHNASEAESSIKRSQDVGFENITIDLIYGSPVLTDEIWLDNLQKINDFNVPHLSAYGLTVEPKTKLAYQIEMGELPSLNDEKMVSQFKTLIQNTREFGLTQYEISNFGKEGFYSQHNSNYWKGVAYLGFGPSAHSYLDNKRFWNVSNNIKYIKALNENEVYFEEETIDEKTAFNEYILTRLRTIWGVEIDYIKVHFSAEINTHFKKEIQPYLNSSYLQQLNNKVVLTDEGILIADKITSDLFYV
ncbi:MAG: radical SAM family heme chaperone HemW [Flavobacteriales bacterium]|nr:radical SAM family heme chaperone HemW [Flavobacteriales bacterium]